MSDAFAVQLAGGRVPWEGRLEMKINDVWGQVCDKDWQTTNYEVLCRELGFDGLGE